MALYGILLFAGLLKFPFKKNKNKILAHFKASIAN